MTIPNTMSLDPGTFRVFPTSGNWSPRNLPSKIMILTIFCCYDCNHCYCLLIMVPMILVIVYCNNLIQYWIEFLLFCYYWLWFPWFLLIIDHSPKICDSSLKLPAVWKKIHPNATPFGPSIRCLKFLILGTPAKMIVWKTGPPFLLWKRKPFFQAGDVFFWIFGVGLTKMKFTKCGCETPG